MTMTTQHYSSPIRAHARKSVAARRVGEGSSCSQCGEARPAALIVGRKPMICAECDRKQHERSTTDLHHFAGRANSPVTIPVPANDHRAVLSEAQNDWPRETLCNPDGSPLLAAAASLRGFIDTVLHLIEKGLRWVAEMLEALDGWLRMKYGSQWWRGTPLEKFALKGTRNAQ